MPALIGSRRALLAGARTIPAWVLRDSANAPAVLAVDAENDRGWFDGRRYGSIASLLAAAGGVQAGGAYVFGPYEDPAAPELLTNGDFATDVSGWTLTSGSVLAYVSPGLATWTVSTGGFRAFAQAMAGIGKAIRLRATLNKGTATASCQACLSGANIALGGSLVTSAATFSATDETVDVVAATKGASYVGLRTTSSTPGGAYNVKRLSAKEVKPVKGWDSSNGYALFLDFATPGSFTGTKYLYSADDDSIIGSGLNRHPAYIDASGNLVVAVISANTTYSYTVATLSPATRYRVAIGFNPSENVIRASVNGATSVVRSSTTGAAFVGAGRCRFKDSKEATNAFDGTFYGGQIFAGPQPAWWLEATAGLPFEGIWTDGDSYDAGAYGYGLGFSLRTATGKNVFITGVGGSTLGEVRDRIAANVAILGSRPLVIWDGSANGYVSAAATLAIVDQILALVPHRRIVWVASVNVGPSGDGSVASYTLELEAIRDGIAARGIEVVDPVPLSAALATSPTAQDLLDIDARVILASQLLDAVHPNEDVYDAVAAAVDTILTNNGWIA